jgi:hypothetical protein
MDEETKEEKSENQDEARFLIIKPYQKSNLIRVEVLIPDMT